MRYIVLFGREDAENPSGVSWFHWEFLAASNRRHAAALAYADLVDSAETAMAVFEQLLPGSTPECLAVFLSGTSCRPALNFLMGLEPAGLMAHLHAISALERKDRGGDIEDLAARPLARPMQTAVGNLVRPGAVQ